MRFIVVSFLLIIMTSCTKVAPTTVPATVTPPPPSLSWNDRQKLLKHINSWQIKGKIAVQTSKDAGSAGVDWSQQQGSYTIALLSPLGTTGLKLTGSPSQVTLQTSDGKTYTANSPEQLLAERWGFKLPLSHLVYWVRGLPAPNVPHDSDLDSLNRLTRLDQAGFHITYLDYTEVRGVDLPNKMTITSPALNAKLIIYRWQI